MAHAKLGLVGLQKGIEAIPDEAWEIFPAFRPPPGYRAKDRRKQARQAEKQKSGDSQDNSSSSQQQQQQQRGGSQDSGYYDQYPQQQQQQQPPQYNQYQRGQPPPQQYHPEASGSSTYGSQVDPRYNQGQPYYPNPQYTPYGSGGTRGLDQNSAPPSQQNPPYSPPLNPPYSPPQNPSYSPPGMSQYQPPQQGYNRPYNPSNYQPQQDDYYGGGNNLNAPARQGDQYGRPASATGYRDSDYYDDDRGRNEKKHHKHDSQSPSPDSGLRGQIHRHFDQSEKGLVSGGVGALAGGFIGHKLGKSPLSTVAGAFIGGLGANAWEARESRHKEEKAMRRRAHSEGRRGSTRADDYNRGSDRDYYDNRSEAPPAPRGYIRDDERSYSRGRDDYYEDEEYDSDDRDRRDRRHSHSRRRD